MTFSFIQMYETSQRASSPSMDVATAAEIKVSEVVSAETVIERLIELKSARSTSDLATLGRSPLLRSRCSKTPKFAISDETLSALSCNQDHRELQRKITRRTAQRDAVPIAATCPCRAGSLATRLHEARPDSKLGWTAPEVYAKSISGEPGRGAALCQGSAPRPLAAHHTEGPTQPRTLVIPG